MAAGSERRVDDGLPGPRGKRGDDLVGENRDVV
jgi:hypothetical protein